MRSGSTIAAQSPIYAAHTHRGTRATSLAKEPPHQAAQRDPPGERRERAILGEFSGRVKGAGLCGQIERVPWGCPSPIFAAGAALGFAFVSVLRAVVALLD